MNFVEAAAKPLLVAVGIQTPEGRSASTPQEAAEAAAQLGPCVVKAQVPTGKRGKAGGIKLAADPNEARTHGAAILGMEIGGHTVTSVLVEQQMPIAREFYAAVLNDPASKGPLIMFSATGGMDIEEIAATDPHALKRRAVDIRHGVEAADLSELVSDLEEPALRDAVCQILAKLYQAYAANDAELMEINPLCLLEDGQVVALDCKFTLEDSSIARQEGLAARGTGDRLSELEARGAELGLKYIALDGDIGVLANGAGLTMTTMDVIAHHGGRAANFLEIGGEAYTKATPALALVLDDPKVKALVVNFCGAFARTDVMTEGVLRAMDELQPRVPFFFCIHGTGAEEARGMLRERLGIAPYATMDEAIQAAIAASRVS